MKNFLLVVAALLFCPPLASPLRSRQHLFHCLHLSLSPSVRGPGAGRPWPNPNSANSVSTRSGGCCLPGTGFWGTRWFLSPDWRCHREGNTSDASRRSPPVGGGVAPAQPSSLLCRTRGVGREPGSGSAVHTEAPAGPASRTGRKELGRDLVQTDQGRRPERQVELSLSCPIEVEVHARPSESSIWELDFAHIPSPPGGTRCLGGSHSLSHQGSCPQVGLEAKMCCLSEEATLTCGSPTSHF